MVYMTSWRLFSLLRQRNAPLRHRHNIYLKSVFLYSALLVVRHDDKVAALYASYCTKNILFYAVQRIYCIK